MVFTRNQKKNVDDSNDSSKNNTVSNTNDDKKEKDKLNESPLQLINNNTSIKAIKRKKSDSDTQDEDDDDDDYVYSSESDEIISSNESENENLPEIQNSEVKETRLRSNSNSVKLNLSNLDALKGLEILANTFKQLEKEDADADDDENFGDENIEYSNFVKLVDKIHSGDFFQRIPPEDKMSVIKKNYTKEEIQELNLKLKELQNMYKNNAPSIIDILKMDVHNNIKGKLLERIHQFSNSNLLSGEYNSHLKYLTTNINKYDKELEELEQQIIKHGQSDEYSDDYRKKLLKSKMPFENKVIAFKRLEIMERYEDSDSSEYAKYKNWMDTLLAVPFGVYNKLPKDDIFECTKNVREILDSHLSFLENPKDQIINIVTQMLRNPDFSINAIGLWGIKGGGKTSISKSIAEALGRPLKIISLGGESDASVLSGHNFTYIGSGPGRIIDILAESKCMNPVVLIDELDKVSQTHQGKEIIGNLIHLTDSTTNSKYNYDRYFSGIEFDISKVLFIFTYNDPDKVDRILADRLYKIKIDNYTFKEKLEITNRHLINNILEEYKFRNEEIKFNQDTVEYIVRTSQSDEGMRDIKRKFEIIVSRINTLLLTKEDENIIRLKYKKLYSYYKELPVTVLKEHVDIFLENSISSEPDIKPPPMGMYL
jgi:ATP-dependent Lon protease